MSYNDLMSLDSAACSQRVSQLRKTMLQIEQLSIAFNGLAASIGEKYAALSANHYAASNMLSLVTLPNELLGRIFEFVVFGNVGGSGADVAHVRAMTDFSHGFGVTGRGSSSSSSSSSVALFPHQRQVVSLLGIFVVRIMKLYKFFFPPKTI